MVSRHFIKQHHIIDAAHIREYPLALSTEQHDALKLGVDQFTPRNNPHPQPGDLTIIAAHANGVSKELYEPLWDDLFETSQASGAFKIRSIWIMDVAWQGEGAVLNESKIGTDRESAADS